MGCVFKLVLFGCLTLSTAKNHILEYFHTATSGIPNFPEFISVGKVDGVAINYYDSIIRRSVPKQTWMEQLDQEYWDSETTEAISYEQTFKVDIMTVQKPFNQTRGVHTYQRICGCQWDDETGTTDSFDQYGYYGEDFLTLDVKQMTWNAPVAEAVPTMNKWNMNRADLEWLKHFLTQECPDRLKECVQYGNSTLQRKVPPKVSLLQKEHSSSVVCHATGFYPDSVMITWKKDGVEMDEDVDVRDTVLNQDGTFQKRAVITVSPEERKKGQYTCEVKHESEALSIMTLKEEGYFIPATEIVVVCLSLCCVGLVVYLRACRPNHRGNFQKRAMPTVSPEERKKSKYTWEEEKDFQCKARNKRSSDVMSRTSSESSSESTSSMESASSDKPLL
ncbi:major histocompatibility complex class I-related protein 1-like [Alosa pseudoharengus]|uniref:major histocompatibility complex class I-related protein 1-like n=1 Tax=Alosa pseudoharengus TaxID=34774 RepID=UPI003F88EB3E